MSELFFFDAPQESILGEEEIVAKSQRQIIPSSNLSVFEASIHRSFLTGPVSNTADLLLYGYGKAFEPDIIEPLIEERKTKLEAIDDILGRAPKGVLSFFNQLGGGAVGFLLDPANLASGMGIGRLVGASSPALVSALRGRNLSIEAATNVGRIIDTTIEGAAVMTPGAFTHLGVADPYEEDFTALEAIAEIGIGAAIGGIAGTIGVGIKSLKGISAQSGREALDDSISQLNSGNSIDVTARVKQGFKDARADDKVSLSETETAQQNVVNKMTEAKARKKTVLDKLDKFAKEGKKLESLTLEELTDRVGRIATKDASELHPIEAKFKKSFRPHAELDRVGEIQAVERDVLTEDEVAELDTIFKDERGAIEGRVSQLEKELKQKEKEVTNETDKAKKEVLEKDIKEIEDSLEIDKNRINNIEKIAEERPVHDALKELDDVENESIRNLDEIESLDVAQEVLSKSPEDLTGAEMKATADGMMDGTHESALDVKDDSFSIEAEAAEPFENKLTPEDEALIDEKVKNKELPPEEIEAIELANEEVAAQSNYKKIIQSVAECILKNTR